MPVHYFRWLSVCCFIAAVIAIWIALFLPGRGLLLPAITPRPETFTELYFEDHLSLPTTVFFGEAYEFTYTIRNNEGKDLNYPVEIFALDETPGSTQSALVIFSDVLAVNRDETKSTNQKFIIPEGFNYFGQKIKVEVLLKNINQRIFFRFVPVSTNSASVE